MVVRRVDGVLESCQVMAGGAVDLLAGQRCLAGVGIFMACVTCREGRPGTPGTLLVMTIGAHNIQMAARQGIARAGVIERLGVDLAEIVRCVTPGTARPKALLVGVLMTAGALLVGERCVNRLL